MTSPPTTVQVQLAERSYEIAIGSGLLARAADFLSDGVSHLVLISDSHVAPRYAEPLRLQLQAAGLSTQLLTVPAGEAQKSVATAQSLWQQLLDCRADRKTSVVAVGGGVIGDLAGFVAATYARGLPFWQVPTTLLAQVDSSVGGKVGVNLPAAKNIIGAFWQPRGVLIDIHTLHSLPDREYRSGLAEVVKYGVILDADFFAALEARVDAILRRDPDVLEFIVARCCRLKADVVEQDEREETGLRAVLNYGHTFGHALESVSGYGRWLHGEAVSIGMVCAARLAVLQGRIAEEFEGRQRALLERLGLPVTVVGAEDDDLLAAMRHDKKTEQGRLRFVLPDRLGHVELVPGVPESQVREVLRACRT